LDGIHEAIVMSDRAVTASLTFVSFVPFVVKNSVTSLDRPQW
jgi:hypothetical protein